MHLPNKTERDFLSDSSQSEDEGNYSNDEHNKTPPKEGFKEKIDESLKNYDVQKSSFLKKEYKSKQILCFSVCYF